MARTHHRKKHKSHLQQFKHSHDLADSRESNSGKATIVFGIGGALFGFAIVYFATSGSIPWIIAGALAGGVIGYVIGKKIDTG